MADIFDKILYCRQEKPSNGKFPGQIIHVFCSVSTSEYTWMIMPSTSSIGTIFGND